MARSLRGEVCLPARASLRRVARASGNRPIPLGGNYGSQKASRAGAVAVGWRAGSTAPAGFTERGLERLVPDRLLVMAVGPRQLDLRLPGPDDPSTRIHTRDSRQVSGRMAMGTVVPCP